jgi:type IV secretory pathway VirB10-like protein
MRTRYTLWATIAVFGLLGTGIAQAGLYKWTDDQGNVIYSQVPPPDRDAQAITPPPPPPQTPAATSREAISDEGETREEKAEREEQQKADKELAKAIRKNCDIAKRNLEIYKTFGRVRDASGNIIALDDKTRAAKIKEAQEGIKQYCKK